MTEREVARILIFIRKGPFKVKGLDTATKRWHVLLSNHDSFNAARDWIARWYPGVPVEVVYA